MNHDLRNRLHIQAEFNPQSDYMAKRKNGVLWLKKAFLKPLIELAEGEVLSKGDVYAEWDSDNRLIIMYALVNDEAFELFTNDYDAFMDKFYGKMSLDKFGVLNLTVSDYAEVQRKAEEIRRENQWDW